MGIDPDRPPPDPRLDGAPRTGHPDSDEAEGRGESCAERSHEREPEDRPPEGERGEQGQDSARRGEDPARHRDREHPSPREDAIGRVHMRMGMRVLMVLPGAVVVIVGAGVLRWMAPVPTQPSREQPAAQRERREPRQRREPRVDAVGGEPFGRHHEQTEPEDRRRVHRGHRHADGDRLAHAPAPIHHVRGHQRLAVTWTDRMHGAEPEGGEQGDERSGDGQVRRGDQPREDPTVRLGPDRGGSDRGSADRRRDAGRERERRPEHLRRGDEQVVRVGPERVARAHRRRRGARERDAVGADRGDLPPAGAPRVVPIDEREVAACRRGTFVHDLQAQDVQPALALDTFRCGARGCRRDADGRAVDPHVETRLQGRRLIRMPILRARGRSCVRRHRRRSPGAPGTPGSPPCPPRR